MIQKGAGRCPPAAGTCGGCAHEARSDAACREFLVRGRSPSPVLERIALGRRRIHWSRSRRAPGVCASRKQDPLPCGRSRPFRSSRAGPSWSYPREYSAPPGRMVPARSSHRDLWSLPPWRGRGRSAVTGHLRGAPKPVRLAGKSRAERSSPSSRRLRLTARSTPQKDRPLQKRLKTRSRRGIGGSARESNPPSTPCDADHSF